MRLPHFLLMLGVSVVLHLAVFWPSPEPPRLVQSPALSVRLQPLDREALNTAPVPEDRESNNGAARPSGTDDAQHGKTPSGSRPGPARVSAAAVEGRASREPDRGDSRRPAQIPLQGAGESKTDTEPVRADDAGDVAVSSGGSLARYRMALAVAAFRMRNPAFNAGGQSGTAVVEVRLVGAARTPQVSLAQSSGVDLIDREAVALLTRAAQAVQVAAAGEDSSVTLHLPLVFDGAPL